MSTQTPSRATALVPDPGPAQPALAPLGALPSKLPGVERRALPPLGFLAGGLAAGIKRSGRADLAVIASAGGPVAAAGVFTTNAFAAAPVLLCRAHLATTDPTGDGGRGWATAVLSTSGCANAATGAPGDADQAAIVAALADALGAQARHVLALSTGLIGTRLPVATIRRGITTLVPAALNANETGLEAAADALMTTDTRRKVATATVHLPGTDGALREVRVTGIAKGVGMIHPRMATMLAVILTDAAVEPATLQAILRPAAARTWNQLTVDGDTSTNDSVLVLASGAAGAASAAPGSVAAATLGRAVEAVARDLARQQAADGEGATTLLVCQVSGAADDADARAVARAVVASSLVKAALHGRDPNWGRIAAAAGNASLPDAGVLEAAGLPPEMGRARAGGPARVEPQRLRISIAGTDVFAGLPLLFDTASVSAAMTAAEVLVRLDLGLGDGSGEAFGCDLTEAYVVENSAYST